MTDGADPAVVIAGGGPVGLTAALALADAGFEVEVLEALAEPSTQWRASTFHAATLELLEPFGIVEEMVERGLIAPVVRYFDRRAGLVAEFDHALIADDTRYPFRLQLEQYKYVEILLERLDRLPNATVRFGHAVVDVTQGTDDATVTVEAPEGRSTRTASFVIGTDGARSAVRSALGIDYSGWTYEQRFLLISTDYPFDVHLPELAAVNYMSDPEEFLFLLRIRDCWRVLVPVPLEGELDEVAGLERVGEILCGIVPDSTPGDFVILDRQLYFVHQRVAERLRDGRVVLAGDAAHVNSPLGGFGLNSGIHDALDLAPRLVRLMARVDLDPSAIDAELDAYDDVRRTAALEHVREMSHRNTGLLSETDPAARATGLARIRAVAADPVAARAYLLDACMLTSVRGEGVEAG